MSGKVLSGAFLTKGTHKPCLLPLIRSQCLEPNRDLDATDAETTHSSLLASAHTQKLLDLKVVLSTVACSDMLDHFQAVTFSLIAIVATSALKEGALAR